MEKFYLKYCENRKNPNQDQKHFGYNILLPIFCIQPNYTFAALQNIFLNIHSK